MRKIIRGLQALTLSGSLGLAMLTPALASDPPEPQFGWSLAFGAGASLQPHVKLGLRYPNAGLEGASPTLLEVEASGRGLLAQLAGVPLLERSFRASQSEEVVTVESSTHEETNWTLWAVGGAAAIAVLVAGKSEDCAHDCDHVNVARESGTDTTGVSADDDGVAVGCTNGTCVVCPDGSMAEHCGSSLLPAWQRGFEERDIERQRWLDAGNGQMGDLLARP